MNETFYFRLPSNRAGVSRCLDVGPDGHSDVYGALPKVHGLCHGRWMHRQSPDHQAPIPQGSGAVRRRLQPHVPLRHQPLPLPLPLRFPRVRLHFRQRHVGVGVQRHCQFHFERVVAMHCGRAVRGQAQPRPQLLPSQQLQQQDGGRR